MEWAYAMSNKTFLWLFNTFIRANFIFNLYSLLRIRIFYINIVLLLFGCEQIIDNTIVYLY